jgi:hypothetical protein
MPTYQKCEKAVAELASSLINKYDTHKPLEQLKVKIDLVFAFADVDEKGRQLNDALTKNGIKALGITRKIPIKDRVLGRGDAEIALDGDYWGNASEEEQAALLDHELHHVAVQTDKNGNAQFDDIGRPKIKLRKHDVEVGWFRIIAERHGIASQERQQAKAIMDKIGQYFWPGIAPTIEFSSGGKTTGSMSIGAFTKVAQGRA